MIKSFSCSIKIFCMRFSFFKITLVLVITVLNFGCKKEKVSGDYGFTFKLAGRIYHIDTLKFNKAISFSSSSNFMTGRSNDGICTVTINCRNNQDTSTIANYIVSDLPQGTYPQKIVYYILVQIKDPSDPNNAWFYKAEPDFTFNITTLNGNQIEGNFSGNVTGGVPVGGFSSSTYLNIRTSKITEGKFNIRFYPL